VNFARSAIGSIFCSVAIVFSTSVRTADDTGSEDYDCSFDVVVLAFNRSLGASSTAVRPFVCLNLLFPFYILYSLPKMKQSLFSHVCALIATSHLIQHATLPHCTCTVQANLQYLLPL
jgi:hypothetical protein